MNFIEEQKRNFSDLILTGLERIHFDNLNRELRNLMGRSQKPMVDFEDITHKELYNLAQEKNLDGRSTMNKRQLYNHLKVYL